MNPVQVLSLLYFYRAQNDSGSRDRPYMRVHICTHTTQCTHEHEYMQKDATQDAQHVANQVERWDLSSRHDEAVLAACWKSRPEWVFSYALVDMSGCLCQLYFIHLLFNS